MTRETSDLIAIPTLAEELKSAAGLSKPAATKAAQASSRAIKKMKPGEIIVLNIGDVQIAEPARVHRFQWSHMASKPEGIWKTKITWISGKKGKPFGVIAGKSKKLDEGVIIVGAISPAELPPSESFRTFADHAVKMLSDEGFSENEIYQLVIPKRTLARRQAKKEPLTVEETDKALRLARITELGEKVFGNKDKANRWLRKQKRTLDGQTPLNYLSSESGARVIEEMLIRIDSGILS